MRDLALGVVCWCRTERLRRRTKHPHSVTALRAARHMPRHDPACRRWLPEESEFHARGHLDLRPPLPGRRLCR
jgi:hypothetical protein